MHRDFVCNLGDFAVSDRETNPSPLCRQDSAWWRATRTNRRRGAPTTFVWPPSLQVTGRAAAATSVFSDCAFSHYNLKASIFHTKNTRIPTKFCVKEGANGNVILLHFDGVDRWMCRWFCKVFDE